MSLILAKLLSFGLLAAYLDQTSRNFFAEQEYGQVNTGDLFNRRTRFGCRWAVCWENETFCGLYREVRAIRRRHFADRQYLRRRTIFSEENRRFCCGGGIAFCGVLGRAQPCAS